MGRAQDRLPLLLFFSVARSASAGQAGRASAASQDAPHQATRPIALDGAFDQALPTDWLVDVTPQALRMSSPFNTGYWLAAA